MLELSTLRRYTLPLCIAALSLGGQLGGELVQRLFQYDREAILGGAVWRLLTGNFLHLGWPHLLLNLAGLVLIWMFFGERFNTRQWLLIIAGTALATGVGLLLFTPRVGWYVGLSGALHGFFIAGCMAEIRLKMREGYWLLALIVVKLLWEQWQGPMPGTSDMAGGEVIVDAHLFGGIAGIAAVLFKPKIIAPYGRAD